MRSRGLLIASLMWFVAAGCGSDVVQTGAVTDSEPAARAETETSDDSGISVVLARPEDWPDARFYPSTADIVVSTDEDTVATTTLDGDTVEVQLPGPGEYRILASAETEDGECWHYAGWPSIRTDVLELVDGDTTLELIDSGEVCN